MAIITCPECGKQISEYAPACVSCGIPMEKIVELLANEGSKETHENENALIHMVANASGSIINSSALLTASKEKRIKCIICSNEYNLSDLYCPKCNHPALTMSNNTETVRRYWKKTNQEDEHAQILLGGMNKSGRGVGQNDAEAVKRLRMEAEQGDAKAQFNLGVRYKTGLGVEQNDAEAEKWYRKAAKQGYADAQRRLGFMYYNGDGVKQNDAKAAKWFHMAAEQGDTVAQRKLGFMYREGRGVKQDDEEAEKWWRMAQYNLGVF